MITAFTVEMRPSVVNAMKVLQACICKSFNARPFLMQLVALSIVKFNVLALAYGCFRFLMQSTQVF